MEQVCWAGIYTKYRHHDLGMGKNMSDDNNQTKLKQPKC